MFLTSYFPAQRLPDIFLSSCNAVEPRCNKPRYNEVLGVTNDFLGCNTYWSSCFTLVCLWCGRTDGRSGGRAYGHVITKFSRMSRLLYFLTHGAQLRARAPLLKFFVKLLAFWIITVYKVKQVVLSEKGTCKVVISCNRNLSNVL